MNESFSSKPKYVDAYFSYYPKPNLNDPIEALHYWVKHGNIKKAEELLLNGVSANALDHKKWTPLHHATVLKNQSMCDLLMQYGGDESIPNDCGATAKDIYWFIIGVKKVNDCTKTTLLLNKDNKPISCKDYYELTKSRYITEQIVKSEIFIKEWKRDSPEVQYPFINELKEKYVHFSQGQKNTHVLKEADTDDMGCALVSSPGLGLFATRFYAPGDIVGEFFGKLKPSFTASLSSINLGDGNIIDSLSFSNEMSRVNDGWPNITPISIDACSGRQNRIIFVATEPINEGEQFIYNYGFHPCKLEPYQEIRPKALKEFTEQHDIDTLIKTLGNKLKKYQEITFEEYCQIDKIRYIYCTLSVCFKLITQGVIKDRNSLVEFSTHFFKFYELPPGYRKNLKDVIRFGTNTFNYYEELKNWANTKNSFLPNFNQLVASKGVITLLNTCQGMYEKIYFKFPQINIERTVKVVRRKVFDELNIVNDKDSFERVAIYGIGQMLTKNDIGKWFVRTCPPSFDWRAVPDNHTVNDAKSASVCLVEITEKFLIFNKKYYKFDMQYNDGNWIELSKYIKFINTEFYKLNEERQWLRKVDNEEPKFCKDETWLHNIPKILFSLPEKYFIKCTFTKILSSDSNNDSDDWELVEAKKALGVSHLNDFSKIKKAYFKLALKYHPDKNTSESAHYLKLKTAYEKIEKIMSENEAPWSLDECKTIDECYKHALGRYHKLKMQLQYKSEEFQLQEWLKFYDLIKKLRNFLTEEKREFWWFDNELTWSINNFLNRSLEEIIFLQICQQLNGMSQEIYSAFSHNNPKEIICQSEDILEKLEFMETYFDLENKKYSWEIVENNYFKLANMMILDYVLALEKAIAENYLLINKNDKAIDVRNKAIKYHENKTVTTESIWNKTMEHHLEKESYFKSRRPKQEEPEKKSTTEEKSSTAIISEKMEDVIKEQISTEEIDKEIPPPKPKPSPNYISEEPELKTIKDNIKKNMVFFFGKSEQK